MCAWHVNRKDCTQGDFISLYSKIDMLSKLYTLGFEKKALCLEHDNQRFLIGFTKLANAQLVMCEADHKSRIYINPKGEDCDEQVLMVVDRKEDIETGRLFIREVTEDEFFSYRDKPDASLVLAGALLQETENHLIFDCQVSR